MTELLGKRALYYVDRGKTTIAEFLLVELSPSGEFARFQDRNGQSYWKGVNEYQFVEVLGGEDAAEVVEQRVVAKSFMDLALEEKVLVLIEDEVL